MPELRRDPVSGRWAILSPERRHRPHSGVGSPTSGDAEECPFCPGNESLTPAEVYVERDPRAPNAAWATRVVPNRYPALRPGAAAAAAAAAGDGLRAGRDGIGVHEVIVESPEHGAELADLSLEAVQRFLRAVRGRIRALRGDESVRYVQVFKNHGATAGASLEHGHAQLIALPLVPSAIQSEIEGAARYRDRTGRCIFCDMLVDERSEGRRVVFDHGEIAALTPWAPRVPYETWLVPSRHQGAFEEADDASLRSLAGALREALSRLRRALRGPDYNVALHTAPFDAAVRADYHWHLEILPRVVPLGGFEWGTGVAINMTPPEEAAETLRRTEI